MPKTGNEFKIFITTVIIFSFFIQWVWWASNTNLDLTRAIVNENSLIIDTYANNTGDRSLYVGHYYSDKLPGLSFLALPPYFICELTHHALPLMDTWQAYGYTSHTVNDVELINEVSPGAVLSISQILVTVLTSPVFSALGCVVLYKLLQDFTKNRKAVLLVVVAYAIATPIISYSTVFYYHAVQTFMLLLSFYLGHKWLKTQDSKLLLASGLVAGLSLSFSVTSLVAGSFALYFFAKSRNPKTLYMFALGVILGALPLAVYDQSIFGNIAEFTYYHMDPAIWPNLVGGTHGFVFPPSPYITLRLLVDPYRGMMFYSPVLALSFIGLFFMLKSHKAEALLVLMIFLSLLAINSLWWAWEGGTAFGARHLLPAVPFLMIPLVFAFEKITPRITNPLLAASVFFMIIGLGPWEWIGQPYTVMLPADVTLKARTTLDMLANPLKDHYFPLFMQSGPRSLIAESLFSGKLDIRQEAMSEAANAHPFVTVLPLLAALAIIWKDSLKELPRLLKENPEIFIVPLLLAVLLG